MLSQFALKDLPTQWSLRRARPTISAHVESQRTNHSAMALTRGVNLLPRLSLMKRKLALPISADAREAAMDHTAMEPTLRI